GPDGLRGRPGGAASGRPAGARRVPRHAGAGHGVRRHRGPGGARARPGGERDPRRPRGVRRAAAGLRGGALPLAGRGRGARGARGHRDGRLGRDGGAAPDAAARGRAVPPRVGALRARPGAGRELAGGAVTDPVDFFAVVAAEHPRCFWLDGGGAREWSGRRSIIGWLDEDDVSLTYDAAAGVVTRHAGGVSEPVGSDVFAALEAELAAGEATDQWFGYFGYAARPDLPAAV